MEYLDFEIEIGLRRGRRYPVVVRSQEGEARTTTRLPLDELQLENRLKDLKIALLSRGAGSTRRKVLTPEEQSVRDFGRILFEALLPPEVRGVYAASRRGAADRGKGLRLKLRIQPPELAGLPWEFLYDPQRADYVCLSRTTPLVRYPDVPQPIRTLTITPPLRILGLVASPTDLEALDTAREQQRVERGLQDLRGRVELTWLEGQTWRALWAAMQRGPWHVFHFIGHGGFNRGWDEGFIALADEHGRAHHLRATQLGRLLLDHDPLRLVLLNSCEGATGGRLDVFSSTAATLVQQGIPAVLAMQYEISDRAAIEFSHAFYESVSRGLPIDAATAAARTAVSIAIDGTVEWGTPVLYMRSPDGVLFELPEGSTSPESLTAEPILAAAAPAPPEAAQADSPARTSVLELYQDGLGYFFARQWERAAELLAEVVVRQPDHRDAAAKLEEARRQLELARLYESGRAAYDAQNWAEAVRAFDALTALQEEYQDAPALLEQARRQQHLRDLYAAARRLHERHDWSPVIQLFDEIHALDPAYDPDGLLASAQEKAAAAAQDRELSERYARALTSMEAGEWGPAAEQLEAIQRLRPGYRQAENLLARARAEQALADPDARSRAEASSARPQWAETPPGRDSTESASPTDERDSGTAEPVHRPTTGAWSAVSHLASRSPLATVAGGWALAHGLVMWLCILARVPFPDAVFESATNGFTLTDWHGWAAAGAGAGAICGLAIGLALLRTAALRGQVQILLVAIPWLFASAFAWVGPFYLNMSYLSLGYQSLDGVQWEIYQLLHNLEALLGSYSLPAFVAAGAATGLVGGGLTGLLVRRCDPKIQLSDILTIVVGWGTAWALAWIIPGRFFHSDELRNLPAVTYQAPWIGLLPVVMFVAGAVAGLIGGRIMLRQIARAHQRDQAAK